MIHQLKLVECLNDFKAIMFQNEKEKIQTKLMASLIVSGSFFEMFTHWIVLISLLKIAEPPNNSGGSEAYWDSCCKRNKFILDFFSMEKETNKLTKMTAYGAHIEPTRPNIFYVFKMVAQILVENCSAVWRWKLQCKNYLKGK